MKIHITAEEVKDATGGKHKTPDGLCRITQLSPDGRQRLSKKQINGPYAPFVKVANKTITFKSHDGDIVFAIKHQPGRHCLTCGERLPDPGPAGSTEEAERSKECIKHVDAHGKKAELSDRWPHGYQSYPGAYDCTVVESKLTKRLMGAGA